MERKGKGRCGWEALGDLLIFNFIRRPRVEPGAFGAVAIVLSLYQGPPGLPLAGGIVVWNLNFVCITSLGGRSSTGFHMLSRVQRHFVLGRRAAIEMSPVGASNLVLRPKCLTVLPKFRAKSTNEQTALHLLPTACKSLD